VWAAEIRMAALVWWSFCSLKIRDRHIAQAPTAVNLSWSVFDCLCLKGRDVLRHRQLSCTCAASDIRLAANAL
jgi:hypothetical protein